MNREVVRAFVQARMSSRRFPGKVLAPLRGEPLILHVVRAVGEAVGPGRLVVATSSERSDDPLVAYLETLELPCFRGPLDDVLDRFRQCARAFPCDWILRVCADSPILDPGVPRTLIEAAAGDVDLVTTLSSDAFPHGQNAELVRSEALLGLDGPELTADDREHVTRFIYRHPKRFVIRTIDPRQFAFADVDLAVETIDDLRRLEGLL